MNDIETRIREHLEQVRPYPLVTYQLLNGVLAVLDLHPNIYGVCAGDCIGGDEERLPWPCPTVQAIATAFGLSDSPAAAGSQPADEAPRWRPVLGFEGYYEVSDRGDVRRVKAGPGTTAGRVLRPCRGSRGALYVDLHRSPAPPMRTVLVHRLVAEAFLPPPGPGQIQVNHIDGDRNNNAVANLEWATQSENIRHAYRTGLMTPRAGDLSGRAKLTWEEVALIRASGKPTKVLAAEFGIERHAVSRIRSGRRWASVPPANPGVPNSTGGSGAAGAAAPGGPLSDEHREWNATDANRGDCA